MNSYNQFKVLIIEDEKPMNDAIYESLSRAGFVNIIRAYDGQEAIVKAKNEKPSLIILDLMLPKVEGLEVLRRIRAMNEWGKKVPIIILTALFEDDRINKAITEHEPSYYFVKTNISLKQLADKVRELLTR